ncbi:MAG: hypothetical protein ACRC92_26595 [Peptostreptococcaceae bacterium]
MIRELIWYIVKLIGSIGAFILTGTFDTEMSYMECDDIRKELYPFRLILRTFLVAIEVCLILTITLSPISVFVIFILLAYIKYSLYNVSMRFSRSTLLCTNLYLLSIGYLIIKILTWDGV